MTLTDGQKRALAVVVAIAIAGAAYVYFTGKSDAGISCYATGQAVGIVAAGLAENKGASEIIASAGFGFLSTKCADWVKTLEKDPTKETQLSVDGADKPSTTVSGETLLPTTTSDLTPTPTATLDIARILECARWNVQLLRDWCYERKIEPPQADYSPRQAY
jgi:hypothetical protein